MNRILNIGSINIDYVYHVNHFVQPGETISSLSVEINAGGKGLNQSIALSKAGGKVYHCGKCSKDSENIVDSLVNAGVDTSFIDNSGSVCGHAIIQIDAKGQNSILLHKGANYENDKTRIEKVIEEFDNEDILVLQNEINDIPFIMQAAYSSGLKIAFNPSPFSREILNYPLEYVDWFFINEVEGFELTGKKNHEDILWQMRVLFPKSTIVLTVGAKGVMVLSNKDIICHGIYDVPVVDTTAAGDTFLGFFMGQLLTGEPIQEAIRTASVASSIAVSRKGAGISIPTLEEVRSAKLNLVDATTNIR